MNVFIIDIDLTKLKTWKIELLLMGMIDQLSKHSSLEFSQMM